MAGTIDRVSSRYHNVKVNVDAYDSSKALITLNDSLEKGLNGNDFVLYFRDSKINEPSATIEVNDFNE